MVRRLSYGSLQTTVCFIFLPFANEALVLIFLQMRDSDACVSTWFLLYVRLLLLLQGIHIEECGIGKVEFWVLRN